MATIQSRPFSKNYSGLINQSVIAVVIFVVFITSHELMKRKRRGYSHDERLGSVESWQFGYLYQGRSWAKKPSPPSPRGWPLSWVKQVIYFPEDRLNELRGVDASLYVRFLRGCVWFTMVHTLTTFPILLPIHVEFSDGAVSSRSMTRASISSLVGKGQSLLWIHLILLIWLTLTWLYTLFWICRGAFQFRAQKIQEAADRAASDAVAQEIPQLHPHPHPQYAFQAPPILDYTKANRGLRMRTIMVSNVPPSLRSERDLKEYFEYYLSRPIAKPSMGVTSTTQPGFLNRSFAFLFNRAKDIPSQLQRTIPATSPGPTSLDNFDHQADPECKSDKPIIDRVVLVRKMDDIASLLERREEVLRCLESAHIKLARKALSAVQDAIDSKPDGGLINSTTSRMSFPMAFRKSFATSEDVKRGASSEEGTSEGENRMQLLIRTLRPYLEGQYTVEEHSHNAPHSSWLPRWAGSRDEKRSPKASHKAPCDMQGMYRTVWEALLSLPRSTLDAYQPLIHLSALFRGKTVPSIDYYTAKLNLLTSLITEKRTMAVSDYPPVSTAFVTFADSADARRACKYLAVHPNNPLNACFVTMAPSYEDLDWIRLMKSTYRVEFVKDWVVNLGVWGFTIFWVFPVSILVGLVSIQNISAFWPGLKRYLDKHPWEEELIQSLLPTLLVALLALLIPLLLLLIAKKAHTISTLSALHDRIMTRYYKFLVVNVLVFFCVGTAALQSFLVSFKSTTGLKLIQVVSESFPGAGPFYVGWCIFTMAMHGGFELALFGLPLIMYPSTKRQVIPRKRAVGIRPRTFNYYYWLPNHLLVIHICLVFAILNPLVIPFIFLYFCVQATVIKNQLLHVYAKNYEGNGKFLLIRLVRYSLDGLILAQAVFLAYMVVLKKKVNVVFAVVLIVLTAFAKMIFTRVCRAKYERDDMLEADILCGKTPSHDGPPTSSEEVLDPASQENEDDVVEKYGTPGNKIDFWTWKLASRMNFSYGTSPRRGFHDIRRPRNPFGPEYRSSIDSTVPLQDSSSPSTAGLLTKRPEPLTSVTELSGHGSNGDASPVVNQGSSPSALVSPHPPHPSWDDESHPDHPYENPYYTRPIADVLWLPRDPLGLLNLDDTVDMRISLTSEPGAGKLGALEEDEFIGSILSSAFATSFGTVEEGLYRTPSPVQFDGSEFINLPPAIASRVESIGQERDVESSGRPSFRARHTSSSSGARPSLGLRRPTTFDAGPSTGFRSSSIGAQSSFSARGLPSSSRSMSDRRRRNRAASLDQTLGLPMDRRAAGSYATKSLLSIVEPSSAATLAFPLSPRPAPNSAISTREAVVGEVIVEEQEAAQERHRQEIEQEEKAKKARSLLTSWMFSKGQ